MVAAGRWLRSRKLLIGGTVIGFVLLILALVPAKAMPLPFLTVAGLAFVLPRLSPVPQLQEAKSNLAEARLRWNELRHKWETWPDAGVSSLKRELENLKQEHDAIPTRRVREVAKLTENKKHQQLKEHLERFQLKTARLPNVGKVKLAMLLSNGIETAADIDQNRILALPGFGLKTTDGLVAFRRACEARFQFDPSLAVPASQIITVDVMLAQRRAKIKADLAAGLARLKALATAEAKRREVLRAAEQDRRSLYAQALADARSVGVA